MAITLIRNRSLFQCLSTDTKPLDAAVGDILFESNTASDWEFDGTTWVKKNSGAVDSTTNARTTIEYEHHEIHSGSHYTVHGFLDIPGANDVLDFTWQMPNTTKWTHWIWEIDVDSGIAWYIYMDAVATNPLANTITPINSNHNFIASKPSATTMKYEIQVDLAAANADTAVGAATLVASGKIGDKQSGGNAGRSHEKVLKQGALYCLRAVATAAGYINFNMNWYEHTNK